MSTKEQDPAKLTLGNEPKMFANILTNFATPNSFNCFINEEEYMHPYAGRLQIKGGETQGHPRCQKTQCPTTPDNRWELRKS